MELWADTADVLMTDESVAVEVLAVPTVFNFLAEVGPAIKQLGEEPATFESEQPAVVPPASEMANLPAEMGREDDQLVTANRPILEEPIHHERTSDELVRDEN